MEKWNKDNTEILFALNPNKLILMYDFEITPPQGHGYISGTAEVSYVFDETVQTTAYRDDVKVIIGEIVSRQENTDFLVSFVIDQVKIGTPTKFENKNIVINDDENQPIKQHEQD